MKDINELLNEMSQFQGELEDSEQELTELEKRRIYQQTMQKIQQEEDNANKEESTHKGLKNFWRKYSGLVAAAATAVIVLAVSATTFAAFHLDDSIRNFFNIQDEETVQKAEKLISQTDTTATCNGVTLSVSQVISDKTRFYAVIHASNLPNVSNALEFEDMRLTANGKNGKKYDYTMQYPLTGCVDNKSAKFGILVSGINHQGEEADIDGKNIYMALKNIGYYKNDGTFVPVIQGTWNLHWRFHSGTATETIPVSKNITILDSKGIWNDIVISPLSVTVHYNITNQGKTHFSQKEWEKVEASDRLTVEFADGSRIDSRFADDVYEEWGTADQTGYKEIGFGKVIDTKEITSVTFGQETIVLHENKTPVERTQITSKAANCSIAFPKEISNLISLEEKSGVRNREFHCKESYAIYWGEKNNTKMPFFSIHRLKGNFSPEDVEKKNPMMTYIGYHNGETYTIQYGEFQDEKQDKEFADIMNQYISNILPFFEYAE